jgi:hypothetical protein
MLLGNIQYFGSFQFKHIPKQVGGGEPEKAYLKFSTQNREIAEALNIPPTTNSAKLNGLYGPVAILLRSEKELIFLDYQELNHSEFVTNIQSASITNLTYDVTTNKAGEPTTNVVVNVRVNITNYISKYVPALTAKQVQADLVEAIIFQK